MTAPPRLKAGMIRKTVTVTSQAEPLARCPFRGCAVRWRTGPDRLCRDHGDETDIARLLGVGLLAADGDDGGAHATGTA